MAAKSKLGRVFKARPEEVWSRSDGAPQGPYFDLTIPSSRNGHGPYRLYRDPATGEIAHVPACEAWSYGRRNCRHVQEACKRAEAPALAFFEFVDALRKSGSWFADVNGFAVSVLRAHDDARQQFERLEELRRYAEERAGMSESQLADEAIAAFGPRANGRS